MLIQLARKEEEEQNPEKSQKDLKRAWKRTEGFLLEANKLLQRWLRGLKVST